MGTQHPSLRRFSQLKLETCGSGSFSQGRNSTVKTTTPPVKTDLGHARGLRTFSYGLPNNLSSSAVPAESDLITKAFVGGTCRGQRSPTGVINDLCINMLMRAKDRESWPLHGSFEPLANPETTAGSLPEVCACLIHCCCSRNPVFSDAPCRSRKPATSVANRSTLLNSQPNGGHTLTLSVPYRPSVAHAHSHSGFPCPYKAPASASPSPRRQTAQPAACRFP
jgi:hypothetical protein